MTEQVDTIETALRRIKHGMSTQSDADLLAKHIADLRNTITDAQIRPINSGDTRMKLSLADHIPIKDIAAFAAQQGCELRRNPNNTAEIMMAPIEPRKTDTRAPDNTGCARG